MDDYKADRERRALAILAATYLPCVPTRRLRMAEASLEAFALGKPADGVLGVTSCFTAKPAVMEGQPVAAILGQPACYGCLLALMAWEPGMTVEGLSQAHSDFLRLVEGQDRPGAAVVMQWWDEHHDKKAAAVQALRAVRAELGGRAA